MEKARGSTWFDNTLFVFVADHSGGYAEYPVDAADYRVPFILYGPKIVERPRRVDAVCSQPDIVPTAMLVLGGRYEHCCFGSDVLGMPRGRGDGGHAAVERRIVDDRR